MADFERPMGDMDPSMSLPLRVSVGIVHLEEWPRLEAPSTGEEGSDTSRNIFRMDRDAEKPVENLRGLAVVAASPPFSRVSCIFQLRSSTSHSTCRRGPVHIHSSSSRSSLGS